MGKRRRSRYLREAFQAETVLAWLRRFTTGGGSRIHVERSTDNGQTWTKIPIDSDDVIQPTILVHSQTRLQLLMRTGDQIESEEPPPADTEY